MRAAATIPPTLRRRPGVASVLFLLLTQAAGALAAADDLPTPGSVLQTLPAERAPRFVSPSQLIFPVQPLPSAFDLDGQRFVVNAFDIQGATVFSRQRLKRVVGRFVDMELNLYDLHRAADDLTRYYHDRGYALARAYVPAQVVKDGVVRIDVVEGRIGAVRFSGNRRYDEGFLAPRMSSMATGTLVTTERLETDLLRLNELPGLAARVVLSPGAEPGATDADVQIAERLIDGSVTVSNFGRRETGQNRLEATINLDAPFGWGDRLTLSDIATQQQLIKYWKLGYSLPVGSEGLRLAFNGSRISYDVAGNLAALGVTGEMKTAEFDLIAPLKRTREDSRTLTLGLKDSRSSQSALGVLVSESRLRLYSVAYTANLVHADAAVTNATFKFDSNFRKNADGKDQDKVLGRFDLDVNHTAPFFGRWDMYLRGNVVYSRDTLPDTEKFALGGPTSVRGFRPSEARGDSGWLITVEMRRPFELAGSMGQARLTGDSGKVVYKMPGFKDTTDSLNSVGVGATLFPLKNVAASLDLAFPTGSSRKATDGHNGRLWMSLSASF